MRLIVTGDRADRARRIYVHVPEAFERRFQEMRSANNAIARVAASSPASLYGLGGCMLGVLWLLRQRALLWRPALVAGRVVAGAQCAALLANAPQAWFSFDTAQSTGVFWGAVSVGGAACLVGGGLAAGAGVHGGGKPVAPRLSRRIRSCGALWSREAAPTYAVLGRTARRLSCSCRSSSR